MTFGYCFSWCMASLRRKILWKLSVRSFFKKPNNRYRPGHRPVQLIHWCRRSAYCRISDHWSGFLQAGKPSFRVLLTSDHFTWRKAPWFQTLDKVVLVIPVSSVAAERRFSPQNNIKTATRSHLWEAKVQNLMTIASAAIWLETFDCAQTGMQFKFMRTRRKVWNCVFWTQKVNCSYFIRVHDKLIH